MYIQFFGLSRLPFSIAPDPHYLFMSERHREALAHLLFGVQNGGGFVLLTGEIGAGKTTVCRLFLEQIPPKCNVAYIFNPKQTVIELLRSICDEFGINTAGIDAGTATVKDFIDPLNTYLLATHAVLQNNVLIIDEAQNLSADVLEQLRLLTNLETNERKLLQIILIGQPELRAMLAQPELEQLAQRVIARFHLQALSPDETAQYITYRLGVAGNSGVSPFTKSAVKLVHRRAAGIPRRINLLCDRALLAAYSEGKREVDTAIIERAAREVFDLDAPASISSPAALTSARSATMRQWPVYVAGLVAAVIVVGGAVLGFQYGAPSPSSKPSASSQLAPPSAATNSSLTIAPTTAKNDKGLAAGVVAMPATTPKLSTGEPDSNTTNQSTNVTSTLPVIGTQARDGAEATRRLGRLWQLTLADNEPCAAALAENVYCFKSSKGLTEIRQLDRPGVLTLYDDAHKSYYVLLRGLSADMALLEIGNQLQTVSLSALARRWEGEFSTLWRGPEGARRGIAKNEQGAAVGWLASRLMLVKAQNGIADKVASGSTAVANAATGANSATARFDAALALQVREFQLSQGLLPDGLAGPQTLMQLASMTDPAEPHLQTMNPATRAWVKK